MSLHPQPIPPVPEQTAQVARAAFPRGTVALSIRDELGTLVTDEDFADLYPTHGQPAQAPWRLALVTILQFVEDLSDRQAADAVRGRIDWKYALALPLEDSGFHSTVLTEFRSRLVRGGAEQRLLEAILDRCRERGWLKARGRQRTDSTHVLGRIRALNRLGCVWETFRHALHQLAVIAPDWLRAHSLPDWVDRYEHRFEDSRCPTSAAQRQEYAERIGRDGYILLNEVYDPNSPDWLRYVPAVETLRQIWCQQFYYEAEQVRWRTDNDGIPPAGQFISSPYDPEARYAKKGTTSWVGYKVHLTESCEEDAPHLITHVETTPGPVADGDVTPVIHDALQEKDLLPRVHLVDTGYLDAELLVRSQEDYAVDLLGPTRADYHWQAQAGQGFAAGDFRIDWEHQQATCPEGRTSISWSPAVDKRDNEVIKIKFSMKDCQACPSQNQCTRGKRRSVTVRHQSQYVALETARLREGTEEFKSAYAKRAGVEGTISHGVRTCGLRHSRYVGEAKTHLQHVLTAAAINVIRIHGWLHGEPRAQTRTSAFAQLMQPPKPN